MVQPYRRTLGVESCMTTRANTSQLPLILAVLTILGGFGGSVWGGAVWLNGKFAEEDSKITAATGDHDKRMTDMQRQIDALTRAHRLVIWDMRGHGRSDYPADPAAYSEALTVADMAALD